MFGLYLGGINVLTEYSERIIVSLYYSKQLPKKSAGLSVFSVLELVNSSCFVDFLSAMLKLIVLAAHELTTRRTGTGKNV